ncbi:hypothetical protein [Hymenobacter yonginensis]|uniref:Uncharacterized protein n=1 Tax=Hymenobacter yonginensis TaxID=748197 RepID=A0ABY7PUW8_9BACT|nr:hypothetical protein [Hymenobacter yonginensis]WBO86710.1 hypothetical protein O9Z63_20735 [Hymenobacter yonginensis]
MLVRCTIDHPDPILHDEWLSRWANGSALELTQGTLYPVLAVSRYEGQYFVFVLGDESNRYPLAFPAALFDLVDGRLPDSWDRAETRVAAVAELNLGERQICSFEPWAQAEDAFYEQLLDEDPVALRRFEAYRDSILAG